MLVERSGLLPTLIALFLLYTLVFSRVARGAHNTDGHRRTFGHVAKQTKISAKPPKRAKKTGRKPVKNVAARPSTTRSTAGPGFDFEDRVAAWLLLKALTGQPTPGTGGTAARLQMQVEALGWTLDDILLTSLNGRNNPLQLAISCKSNVQVTNSALPPDFVARCWQQWFKPDPDPMRREKDSFALVTRGANNVFMATWSELKNAAPGSDVALAVGRMRAASKQRALFESVKSPAKDAGAAVSDADVVAMVNVTLCSHSTFISRTPRTRSRPLHNAGPSW